MDHDVRCTRESDGDTTRINREKEGGNSFTERAAGAEAAGALSAAVAETEFFISRGRGRECKSRNE
jgi:hypothetical protein